MQEFLTNDKHRNYIKRSKDFIYNVAEGGFRAGKTIDNIVAFHYAIERSPDKMHLASAASEDTAKTILGDSNGLGLEHIYKGRCRWSRWKDKDVLLVRRFSDNKQLIIAFSGAAKANNYETIRGRSYGCWICTEIDLHHDSFIAEALRRTGASKYRRLFFDFNPTYPSHAIYKRLAKWEATGKLNYEHYQLFDNPSLTKQQIDDFLSDYEEGSIWYRRDILGERLELEGAIYLNYNKNTMLVDKCPFKPLAYFVGVDWGYSSSHTAFTLIATDYTNVCVLWSKGHSGPRSSTDNIKFAKQFHEKIKKIAPYAPSYPDHADAGLTRDYHAFYPFAKSFKKMKILTRIKLLDTLMVKGRFTMIERNTKPLQDVIVAACWNPKVDNERLDDASVYQVDYLDSLEYACHEVFLNMERNGIR